MKRMNSTRIRLSLLAVLLLCAGLGIWFFLFRPAPKQEFDEVQALLIEDLHIDQLENGRVIAVSAPADQGRLSVGQDSLYMQDWRFNIGQGEEYDNQQTKGEHYYLYSYDLSSKKEKTLP